MILSPSELAALQELAWPFFNTPVDIYRPVATPQDPTAVGYDPTTDYGDDVIEEPQGSPTTFVATAFGWLFSIAEKDTSAGNGQLSAISAHEMRFKLGTDIRPLDVLMVGKPETTAVGPDPHEWVVIDTNADDAWPDMLRVGVRQRSD